MEAVLLIGIQASGKTTFYEERFSDTHLRVSLDLLKTRARERDVIDGCLAAGRAFVVDNTNVSVERRAEYIAKAKAAGFRVAGYFLRTELGAALKRNRLRPGKGAIPPAAVVSTYKRLQVPSWSEGFDELYVVEVQPEGGFSVAELPRADPPPAPS